MNNPVTTADVKALVEAVCRAPLAALEKPGSLSVMRVFIFAILAALLAPPASAQDFSGPRAAATELQMICRQDRGRLWGVDLCGPLIVVEPTTRAVWASAPDGEGVLAQFGDAWIGTLPQGVPMANAAVDWAGVRWIMVLGPLPEDATDRRVLVAHEAWHRVQNQIGLAAGPSDAAHLETENGRRLMRLEMRALASALLSRGAARRRAAQDALMFRIARLSLTAGAAAAEAALDRNEGLAAYTGVRLGAPEPDFYAARTLDRYDENQALARSYAYATGPAYGLLLDDLQRNWRRELGQAAPADLLSAIVRPRAPTPDLLREGEERYGGRVIAEQERVRAETQRVRIAELRQRFTQGPRLELPLAAMQFEFDPTQVTPIEGLGSVYAMLTLRDRWGELSAVEGALIDPSFTRLVVALPAPDARSGPGWRLALAPGYRIVGPGPDGALRVQTAPLPQ